MSKSLRGRLLAAAFSSGVFAAAAAPAAAETLADAVAMAYATNPTLQAQRATQRALDETYVQARAGWRPTLNLQAVATYDQLRVPQAAATLFNPRGIRESNSGSLGMTLSQPVWTGGRTASAVSAAQAAVLQGRENLRRLEGQVMASVIQAYEDVRRDQASLAVRQEDMVVLQKQLDESRARFDVGEVTRTDVAQSEARLAASQAQLQSAQAQLAISRANYAALVGQNPGQLAPEPSLAYLLPGNVDDAFSVAEKYNPQLRAQQFAEEASRARVAAARAERMPRLDLQATGRFINGPVDPFERDRYSRDVTVSGVLTVPLMNGGLTSSRIRQSIETNNADRITVETQRRAVLQQITQTWNQLIAARGNIGSNAQQVKAAEIAAEGTHEEQQVGLRTTIDVLNADVELRAAQLALIAAQHDEYVAAANLLLNMGRLEARDLIPTVPQYSAAAHMKHLRIVPGWAPWEEPIGAIDRLLAFPSIPQQHEAPLENPIGPGLQPPPAVSVPAAAAQPR